MPTKKELYLNLLNLTQLYLLREYSMQEHKQTDPLIHSYFQKHLKKISQSPLAKKSLSPVQIQNQPSSSPSFKSSPPPITLPPLEKLPSTASNTNPTETHLKEIPSHEPSPQASLPSNPPAIVSSSLNKKKEFSLEPLKAPSTTPDFHEFWKILPQLFPQWHLSQSLPNDAIAKKNRDQWIKKNEVPSVIIITFNDKEPQLSFLKNIAQAISLRFAPAKVVSAFQMEKESTWENLLNPSHLRLVIASDYGLYLEPQLMRFYQENRKEGKHSLNQIPLLLLSDISLYLKDPQLKPFLWRAICNEFSDSKRGS